VRGIALVLALSCGCRFGGPTDDPTAGVNVPSVTKEDAIATDTSSAEDSETPGETSGEDAGDTTSGGDASCTPGFMSAVCDPIANTGCGSLSRCDVDDGKTNAGRCVGLASLGEGAFCTKTSLTDTCGAKLTCVDNKCRKLCLCDADCAGRCCKFSVPGGGGASGFLACDDC
jgi:hypothetical protein